MDRRSDTAGEASRIWQGVRMLDIAAGPDPDAAARVLTIPSSWGQGAAGALAALAPGDGPVTLPRAAAAWIRPIAARARAAGQDGVAERLHELLLLRRAAPTVPVWQGALQDGVGEAATPLGFVLNLPAFHVAGAGFDADAFGDAAALAATALHLADPGATRFEVAMSDLDGLLALLGLDYDGAEARDVARNLAALLRARTSAALAGAQPDLLSRVPGWPAPPVCALPGLHAAAMAARAASLRCAGSQRCTAILPPGPADALLGVETGGIAPAFSPVSPDDAAAGGRLTRAAQARLAARGLSAEAALAAALSGDPVLPPASAAAHEAMHDAIAPFIQSMPPRPGRLPVPSLPPRRRDLPTRRRGWTQRTLVGGHRVNLTTGEYPDGSLGEIEIRVPRESAALRATLDHLAAAVSLGLQHGVPLQEYVDSLTLTRFGPAGAVEGDGAVRYATSVLDYVFRTLAHAYLGGCTVPEAGPGPDEDPAPLLPMELPRARRPGLRLVSSRAGDAA